LLLLSSGRADARQPGLATNCGVAMNNSALGRFVDGRDERADVARLRVRISGPLTQSANTTQNLTIAQSAALDLACTFGSGFGISHEKKAGGSVIDAPGFVNRDAEQRSAQITVVLLSFAPKGARLRFGGPPRVPSPHQFRTSCTRELRIKGLAFITCPPESRRRRGISRTQELESDLDCVINDHG